MKEDLDYLYEVINYEYGFGPSEVKPYMKRKWLINIHAIVEAASSLERKQIFGEDRESSSNCHSFFIWFIFVLMDKMGYMKKILDLDK